MFNPTEFLEILVNTDACDSRTDASAYLDKCEMGTTLKLERGVLTVEDKNGKILNYKVEVKQL